MGAHATLGAEEELHLVDTARWQLAARAPQLLAKLPPEHYSAEIQRTTVETNTGVVTTLEELRAELLRLRRGLVEVAGREGLGLAAVGAAPRSEVRDFELTDTGRYGRMQEQYRLLVDEQLICGTQIHVGVADRGLAVEIAQRVARHLPVLLALSASSPYWNGQDTGYASIRTMLWQRWPTAGATGPIDSAAEYDELLDDLIRSGVIADAKMAYFDVRPSSHVPTLELRVCDACPVVDDAVLIAGVFRALVRTAELEIEAGEPRRLRPLPLHRAAMWQAARAGLSGRLLDDSDHPQPVAAAEAVRTLLARARPALEENGDLADVTELAESVLTRGDSAHRQREAFARRGDLADVLRLVVQETERLGDARPA
jgi:carboxylate-amine ligase